MLLNVIEKRNYAFESQNHEINNSEDKLEKCTSLSIKQRAIFNKVCTALNDEHNPSWREW